MNYWLFVCRPITWENLKDKDYWPFVDKIKTRGLNEGDEAIIYVSQQQTLMAVGDMGNVTGFCDNEYYSGRKFYPLYVPVNWKIKLKNGIPIKEALPALTLFKDKSATWGSVLQKTKVRLTKEDFCILYKLLERARSSKSVQ